MSRPVFASFACFAVLALAAGADAREYRFFNGSDAVYYQRNGMQLERVVEPHFHLTRAERAFARGNRAYAAENLEKAATGFSYFAQRAAGTDRRQLDLAGQALEKLAHKVRANEVGESTEVDRAIADARRVLAGEAVMSEPEPAPAAAAPTSTHT